MNFKQSVVDVVAALNADDIRYLIVGDLAVASHGYLRTTKDIDLVVALDPQNVVGLSHRLPRRVTARVEKVNPDLTVRVVRLEVLLDLKRESSRPQDLADIDALTKLYEE